MGDVKPSKILVVGSADGRLRELFAKVQAIDAKHGKFDLLVCLGNFFAPPKTKQADGGDNTKTKQADGGDNTNDGGDDGGDQVEEEMLEGDAKDLLEGDQVEEEMLDGDAKDLLEGSLKVPMPTYIMQGSSPLPLAVRRRITERGGDVADDVLFLGRQGLLNTPQGLRIAVFGGKFDLEKYTSSTGEAGEGEEEESEKTELVADPSYTHADLRRFMSRQGLAPPSISASGGGPSLLAAARAAAGSKGISPSTTSVDLLLTHSWPTHITLLSKVTLPSPSAQSWGAPPVAELVKHVRPRYHFAGGEDAEGDGAFWEREPYEHVPGGPITRFVSLAKFGNPGKKRWFYAFNISPGSASGAAPRPPNTTPTPFFTSSSRGAGGAKRGPGGEVSGDGAGGENYRWAGQPTKGKRPRTDDGPLQDGPPPPGYVCRICQSTEHYIRNCPQKGHPSDAGNGHSGGGPGDVGARAVSKRPPEGYVCKACGSSEHFIRDCPMSASHRQTGGGGDGRRPPEGYVCKLCGSSEHFIRECPEAASNQPANSAGSESRKPPEGYVCKLCNGTDHLIRDCALAGQNASGGAGGVGKRPPEGYVCKICNSSEHFIRDCPDRSQPVERPQVSPDECWFCLQSKDLAKHLIVSIGRECYVALPKGQLPQASDPSSPVPGGGHVLIIPISHFPSLLAASPDVAVPVVAEMESYKSALRECYRAFGAVPVFFEVGRVGGRAGHAHVQVVPVPKDKAAGLEEAFREEGHKLGYEWEADPDKALTSGRSGGNYFRLELPEAGKKLVYLLTPGRRFNLQFPRTVLANCLGMPERADWKACARSDAIEGAEAKAFKQTFAPYAPKL